MKYFYCLFLLFIVSCSKVDSKNNDLISPCAGCDERITPKGNLQYIL